MFSLTQDMNYYLYSEPIDMRKGFNGLSGLIQSQMDKDYLSGDVFIFINKSRNKMKLLRWEPGGLVLYYKRLEQGTFSYPIGECGSTITMRWSELILLIEGITIQKYSKRKRFLF